MKYALVRVGSALLTLYLAATLDFLLPRLLGGNPAQYLASTSALGSPAAARALARQFGLSDPNLLHQYGAYLWQLAHGNLGISYQYYPEGVADVVLHALPFTVAVVLTATLVSFAVGWAAGIISAWRRGSKLDQGAVGGSVFLHAVPHFWLAMVVLYVFAFQLELFPLGHALPDSVVPLPWYQWLAGIVWHAVLPILTLVVVTTAGHLLVMRNNMITVLSDDYMRLARAKGVKPRSLMVRYAARNAILPSFTGLVLSLGNVVGGALMIEIVFSYPGIGYTVYTAITNQDYPVIQGCFMMIAVAVILANLAADFAYPLIDPRVRLGTAR